MHLIGNLFFYSPEHPFMCTLPFKPPILTYICLRSHLEAFTHTCVLGDIVFCSLSPSETSEINFGPPDQTIVFCMWRQITVFEILKKKKTWYTLWQWSRLWLRNSKYHLHCGWCCVAGAQPPLWFLLFPFFVRCLIYSSGKLSAS